MTRRARIALAVSACAAAVAFGAVSPARPAPPQRVCSLSLAGDELLALLVPPERVACVSSFVDDPEISNAVGRFPKSIPRLAARLEPVLSTRPDLVLAAPWNDRTFLDLLGKTGVPSYVLPEADTFPAIRVEVLDVGRRLGESTRAEAVAVDMDRRLAALDRRVADVRERPRVLSFSHLIVAGTGTTVDALIARAGARNAAAEIGVHGHQQVTMERILALDPDWLLLGFDPGESKDTLLAAYPLLATTRAAKAGRIVVMAPRRLTTVTPFLVDGAEELARALHPGCFR